MKILCDTNIFIHFFDGHQPTASEMKKIGIDNILIPFVAQMEMFRGMQNRQDKDVAIKRLKVYRALQCNEKVSALAVEFVRDFKLSHDLHIPDAIIGAMAITYRIPLFTYNRKDFQFMPGIVLY